MAWWKDRKGWDGWLKGCSGHGQSARANTKAHTLGSEVAAVASSAVDLPIWAIVQIHRVQRASAVNTAEAPLVPNL